MFIIPLPWNRREVDLLQNRSDAFDLIMDGCTMPYYLVIRDNKLTWIGQGKVPGKVAYQIKSRSSTMNERGEIPVNHGNVGLFGNYSGIEDAVLKLFPKTGHCVSAMKFGEYRGQKLKGHKDHYNVIEPILRLLGSQPSDDLKRFFQILGWKSRTPFDCAGRWETNMILTIDGQRVDSLETWFSAFCSIALG